MTQPTTSVLEPAPTNILHNLIITLLAPMFLGVAGGDIAVARAAAAETLAAYRAGSNADLITIAQIIAFGLAALGSLSLSMADDISLSMALRLRNNANACNRSAERNRRALETAQAETPPPPAAEAPTPADYPTEETLTASIEAAQKLAAQTQARIQKQPSLPMPQRSNAWATAMIDAAEKINATLGTLPPSERRSASLRAATLATTATGLLSGIAAPSLHPN